MKRKSRQHFDIAEPSFFCFKAVEMELSFLEIFHLQFPRDFKNKYQFFAIAISYLYLSKKSPSFFFILAEQVKQQQKNVTQFGSALML